MDTCPISCGRRQINCWRKQKSGTTTNKSIYNQQDLFSGEGPEDWSTVIICSFHWIIFCSRVLLKEMRQISNVHLNVLLIIFSNKIVILGFQRCFKDNFCFVKSAAQPQSHYHIPKFETISLKFISNYSMSTNLIKNWVKIICFLVKMIIVKRLFLFTFMIERQLFFIIFRIAAVALIRLRVLFLVIKHVQTIILKPVTAALSWFLHQS